MEEPIAYNLREEQKKQSVLRNMVSDLWQYVASQDKFTKMFFLSAILLSLVTPIIVSSLLQTKQHAGNEQASLYFTLHGSTTPLANPTFTRGQNVVLDLYLNGQTRNITGFDIATALANTNTLVLAQPGITEGSDASKFSVSLLNSWENNRWHYTRVNVKTDAIATGQMLLATIPFTALGNGQGSLDFSTDTAVTAADSPIPLSVAKYSVTYTVADPPITATPAPTGTYIYSFDPESGPVGSDVTMYVKNIVINNYDVIWDKEFFINNTSLGKFYGSIFSDNNLFTRPEGMHVTDSDGYVLFTIPTGATTGKIRGVTRDGKQIQSSSDFTVTPGNPIPVITNLSVTKGPPWTEVDVNGRNFGGHKLLSERQSLGYGVFFNGVRRRSIDLSDSTWQSLYTMAFVPDGAQTGKITLKNLWNESTQSQDVFTVTKDFGEAKRIEANRQYSLQQHGSEYGATIGSFDHMTIEFWINPQSGGGSILSKGAAFNFVIGQDKKLLFKYSSNTNLNNDLFSTSQIQSNTWTHVAAVYDGSAVSLYINGKREVQKSQTGKIILNTGQGSSFPINIGAVGNQLSGQIDELRISNVARYSGDSFSIPAYSGEGASAKQFVFDPSTILLFHFNRTDFGQGMNGDIVDF